MILALLLSIVFASGGPNFPNAPTAKKPSERVEQPAKNLDILEFNAAPVKKDYTVDWVDIIASEELAGSDPILDH